MLRSIESLLKASGTSAYDHYEEFLRELQGFLDERLLRDSTLSLPAAALDFVLEEEVVSGFCLHYAIHAVYARETGRIWTKWEENGVDVSGGVRSIRLSKSSASFCNKGKF